jgi:hypothetical protein
VKTSMKASLILKYLRRGSWLVCVITKFAGFKFSFSSPSNLMYMILQGVRLDGRRTQ